jgi:tetratricopeptide (TPR) repeat protein
MAIGSVIPATLLAQSRQDYTLANQLMKQENYQEALAILRPLLQKQPTSQPVYQRTMECMVQLKQYEEGISLSDWAIDKGLDPITGNIKKAELLDLNGQKEAAKSTWEIALNQRSGLNTYLTVARSMKDRGRYEEAIAVYEQAQEMFENGRLFLHELAYTHLLAGEYEDAMRSFVQLIIQNPRRFSYVQRNLQRYSDPALFDAAILETDDALADRNLPSEAFNQLVQLNLWLLMERELYERALSQVSKWIRQERVSPYLMIDLGGRLRSVMAYRTAVEAFEKAESFAGGRLRSTTLFEKAQTYEQWALQERQQNRLSSISADSLNKMALRTYQNLLNANSNYEKAKQVYGSLTELYLTVQQDTSKAQKWLADLARTVSDPSSDFQFNYLKGRIALFKQDYMSARINLTRAIKLKESDQNREHMRYLLGLADFYNGDYEFARTQLDALKNQSTSLFTNDALQLKLWLNEGGFADSTGKSLNWLAQLHRYTEHRQFDEALIALDSLQTTPAGSLLKDDALYLLSREVPDHRVPTYYLELHEYLITQTSPTPLHERLLWERIQRGEQLIQNTSDQTRPSAPDQSRTMVDFPTGQQDIIAFLRSLLEQYPNGFYAEQARVKLRHYTETDQTTTS